MRKNTLFGVLGAIEVVLVLCLPVQSVRAETRIGGTIDADTVWPADNGPYLLTSDVSVPDGVALTIKPGAVIGVAPESMNSDASYNPVIYVNGGVLRIEGSPRQRISVNGIGGIFVTGGSTGNGSVRVANADLKGGSSIYLDKATAIVASTTISGAYTGISSKKSSLIVWGSHFFDDEIGIEVQPDQVFMASRNGLAERFGTGGIGNAVSQSSEGPASSSVTVRGSIFLSNAQYAIANRSNSAIDAAFNWWGGSAGPVISGGNSILGPAVYYPWLLQKPSLEPSAEPLPCCSSVIFLPGLEGSRLYRSGSLPLGLGTLSNRLWEPNRNADVKVLYMSKTGSSTDPGVYSGGPLDKALGLFDIYGGFMGFLDGLKAKGTVNDWKAFGYDWRKPIDIAATGLEKRSTTTESLLEAVAQMASSSKTGKVSIIAHSNGGLVAKYLVKALVETGKASLIDSVISVAVPFLGTPAAIPALLHGDGQSIGYGLILSAANARGLAANMPSAYSLLPSREFFSHIGGPTIAFASTTVLKVNDGSYPASIDSYDGQIGFIEDAAGARRAPAASDTSLPIKGNRLLLAAADLIHGLIDPFSWPETIARWTIVGWNNDTPTGVSYSSSGYSVMKGKDGDGTVLSESAAYGGGRVVSIDLKEESRSEGRTMDHMSMIGASSTESAIASILSAPAGEGQRAAEEISGLPGFAVDSPAWRNRLSSSRELRISTHSPVSLHVYDSEGNHTGEIPAPSDTEESVEPGLYSFYESKIPGSAFDNYGAMAAVTVPDDGQKYDVVVEGTGVGAFALDIERSDGSTTLERLEFTDIPVTPLTAASTTIWSSGAATDYAPKLASSTRALELDIDGDGSAESSFAPGQAGKPNLFGMMKKLCDRFGGRERRCASLLKRLARLDQESKRADFWRSHQAVDLHDAQGMSGHKMLSGLSAADRSKLMDELESLAGRFEK